jgi:hypothetical protein
MRSKSSWVRSMRGSSWITPTLGADAAIRALSPDRNSYAPQVVQPILVHNPRKDCVSQQLLAFRPPRPERLDFWGLCRSMSNAAGP